MEDLQALQSARKTSHTNKMMVSIYLLLILIQWPIKKSDDLQKLTTQLAYFKSKLEELTEKNLTAQEEIDKKMELYQQKVK